MGEAKTRLTGASVDDFLDTIENDQVRDDCRTIARIIEKTAKAPPRLAEFRHLLDKLGTHSCGKGCLYIKRLSDEHLPTLTKLVNASVAEMRKAHSA